MWVDINKEGDKMIAKRKNILEKIAKIRNSTPILYVTGDRRGMEVQIAGDVIDIFGEHLETINGSKKISLILYTLGGNTLAAWNLVNMIREYCDDFEVIVLNKARSAGTLISLGANRIVMTNISTLGPIDPSLTTPFNPVLPNSNPQIKIPISVEDVKGYIDFAKKELNISKGSDFKQIYNDLSNKIHPLVIGSIFRSKEQIKMLATKLLDMHFTNKNKEKANKIISFLCSDSGSHDYTINKKEAITLGLPIETASEELKVLLHELQINISQDLKLKEPFDPVKELRKSNPNKYLYRRGIIESINGGSHNFISEGIMTIVNGPNGQNQINDNRTDEEWRKVL